MISEKFNVIRWQQQLSWTSGFDLLDCSCPAAVTVMYRSSCLSSKLLETPKWSTTALLLCIVTAFESLKSPLGIVLKPGLPTLDQICRHLSGLTQQANISFFNINHEPTIASPYFSRTFKAGDSAAD